MHSSTYQDARSAQVDIHSKVHASSDIRDIRSKVFYVIFVPDHRTRNCLGAHDARIRKRQILFLWLCYKDGIFKKRIFLKIAYRILPAGLLNSIAYLFYY